LRAQRENGGLLGSVTVKVKGQGRISMGFNGTVWGSTVPGVGLAIQAYVISSLFNYAGLQPLHTR